MQPLFFPPSNISLIMIRTVRNEDSQAITDIYNYYVANSIATFDTQSISQQQMLKNIQQISAAYPYYVYEADGIIAGYCYAHAWKTRKACQLTAETTVYISPQYTGKGIGRALMERLIQECQNRKLHALIACVTAENTASCVLHERLGFEKVSTFREVAFKLGQCLGVADYELLLTKQDT